MDTDEVMRQFDQLESKIENLFEQYHKLENLNSQLRNRVAELEAALDEKIQAENQHTEQTTLIRSKIDNLLARLNEVAEIERTR